MINYPGETGEISIKNINRDYGDVNENVLAIYIGRVAAHELGHYLFTLPGHVSNGIMREKVDYSGGKDFNYSLPKGLEAELDEWCNSSKK